jgi:hypothetical protein
MIITDGKVDIKFVQPEDEDEDENLLVDLVYLDVSVFWPVGGKEKNFRSIR